MKKSLLILLLLFSAVSINAQTSAFYAFPDSNAVWNFHTTEFRLGSGCFIDEQYSILMDGDSLINNIKYNKLSIPYVLSNTIGCNETSIVTAAYKGAVRVDSVNKKVFYVPPTKNSEELLYDFTLEVGDTIKGYLYSNSSAPTIVQAIDSVVVGSNYRKRWLIDSSCIYPIYIIEGIGSTFGLIESIPPCEIHDGANYELECFQDNLYTYNTSGSCQIITALEKNKSLKSNFSIYPNPTSGIVRLENTENLRHITVYNLQGQKVQEINPKIRSWELPKENGLYFIRLEDKRGNYYSKKIIKN